MSPRAEIVAFEDAAPPSELRARVASILERGGLVAMPTETVYGIAARADLPRALAALRGAKGRPEVLPLTWTAGSAGAVEVFPHLRPLVRRLVDRYWPGPLTLVLEGVPPGCEEIAQGGWTGVRVPAHRGTAELLDALPFPAVLTSANRSGEPPVPTAAGIAETFCDAVELVLDGGTPRLNEPSGVLRVGRGRFELLRPGLLEFEDLRRTAGLAIGFCCTGNTCRSPMAEALAREALAERLGLGKAVERISEFGFRVVSMGVLASAGGPPSAHAVEVLAEEGIDASGHRTRPPILEELLSLDRVYGMGPHHLESLRAMLPPEPDVRLELIDPDGESVPDPVGGSVEDYRRCRDHLRRAVRRRAEEWA